MKVFMLWTYYPDYLDYFYKKNDDLAILPFEDHRQKIFDDCFGWPAALAEFMNDNGYDVEFVIENDKILQQKWAIENDIGNINGSSWREKIVLSQIKKHQPDLLLIPNPTNDHYRYIDGASGDYKRLAFYLGHDVSNDKLIDRADMLLASIRAIVEKANPEIDNLYDLGIFFPDKILDKTANIGKIYDVVFAGSISSEHHRRAEILSYLIENGVDLKVYSQLPNIGFSSQLRKIVGDAVKRRDFKKVLIGLKNMLFPSNFHRNIRILSKVCMPPVYGIDFYQCLASAKICLNIHIDLATDFSGNMRMYECTGVGACMVTDKKITNSELFDVNNEIIEFSSKEHLLHILRDAELDNYADVAKIAKKGQLKTLSRYTVSRSLDSLNTILEK
jgi:hypothetical protein